MVSIEDIDMTESKENKPNDMETLSPSQERMLDAEEIQSLIGNLKRPTAKMQLEAFVQKMKKEAIGLKAIESSGSKTTTTTTTTKTTSAAPVVVPPPEIVAPKPVQIPNNATAPSSSPSVMYTNIDRFSFDAGGYNEKFVTLYLPLQGVGSIPKSQIECQFDKDLLDVRVMDLNGKNYRLKKDSLEHDIDPGQSKYIVKADKIVVKLAKIKGEYGSYDYWSKLTDIKKHQKKAMDKSNPAASLNEMMREMYENGDDNMRKMIGETMLKQRNGELNKPDLGAGGGFGDMDI